MSTKFNFSILILILAYSFVYSQNINASSNSNGDCIDVAVRDSPVKLACSAPIDPVCGCDGITYENSCRANNAGVKRFTNGPCSVKTGTGVTAPNDCISQVRVACPPSVAEVFDPVCGCDGVTYKNECIARNSVNRFIKGPCGKGSDPNPDDCIGKKSTKPCTSIPDNVCGCDGKTYANPCAAEAAGVQRFTKGPCGKASDPNPNDCIGKRADKICTSTFDPVCGCDGKTYSNACVAEVAGVRRFIKGECGKKGNNPQGGWNTNNMKKLDGCALIWDHINNWKGKNNERGSSKISFDLIPDNGVVSKVAEFKKSSGGTFLDVKVLDAKKLSKADHQMIKNDNIEANEIIVKNVKFNSLDADSSFVNQQVGNKTFVLNAENNELNIRNQEGKVLFSSLLTGTSAKNEMWGRCDLNGKKYLVRVNWIKGEISSNGTFKELR